MGNTANARALFERALAEVTGEASAPLWDRFLQVRQSGRGYIALGLWSGLGLVLRLESGLGSPP